MSDSSSYSNFYEKCGLEFHHGIRAMAQWRSGNQAGDSAVFYAFAIILISFSILGKSQASSHLRIHPASNFCHFHIVARLKAYGRNHEI